MHSTLTARSVYILVLHYQVTGEIRWGIESLHIFERWSKKITGDGAMLLELNCEEFTSEIENKKNKMDVIMIMQ